MAPPAKPNNPTGGSFFTFVSTASTAPPPPKKSVSKETGKSEAIFVTESPQTMYNKKNNKRSTAHNSSEEMGSDDDMFEEIRSSSSYKMMSSKEKRQLRNKISARNFRVRRKEYITQLEEKVSNHEETIDKLKEENAKLKKANEDLMQQLLLNQAITPPASDNASPDSSFDNSPVSVPESTLPNTFQFPFDDFYELNLFNIPPPPSQDSALFINHMSLPEWNIPKVLDDKQHTTLLSSYEAIYDDASEIIHQYPLLAPALMSIVLRHTLSLEYVQSYAQELQQEMKQEDMKKKEKAKDGFTLEYIVEEESEELTDEELSNYMLNYSFSRYVSYRMCGLSHQQVINRAKHCLKGRKQEMHAKMAAKDIKLQEQKKKKQQFEQKKNTLFTYCQVAGKLLRNPERMANVGSVIKQTQAENHQRRSLQIGGTYGMGTIASSFRNLRISRA
ncbi:hypothetical protein K501DRAFT_177271 [Backusella circina FSU 941]|nr:hypothetical protein K501DRAFT_177271 [Backusella circina FSU 941]